MKLRFLGDANLDERFISGVRRREPSLDFLTATEANLHGLPDLRILEIAADEGRVLVTHDRKTMPYAFGTFIAKGTSPGVIILPQGIPLKVAMFEILLIWSASDAEEWRGLLVQINRPPSLRS